MGRKLYFKNDALRFSSFAIMKRKAICDASRDMYEDYKHRSERTWNAIFRTCEVSMTSRVLVTLS